jgi:hypothetical protein
MTVAYLSGPMRGYDRFNFDAFTKAAADLRSQFQWTVISPAEHDLETGFDPNNSNLPEGFIRQALTWDIEQLMNPTVDTIALLPGWHNSSGVRLELEVAKAFGLKVVALYQDADGYYQIITPHQHVGDHVRAYVHPTIADGGIR